MIATGWDNVRRNGPFIFIEAKVLLLVYTTCTLVGLDLVQLDY